MEDITLTDWYRIFIGDAPWTFLYEVTIRTIVIYMVLLVVLRLMGKRMTGQISLLEMTVMITLGAIVAAPMQISERGILYAVVSLISALLYHRGVIFFETRKPSNEILIQGREVILVKDGVLQLHAMDHERVSRQQLYAVLRNEKIYNLGVVERAYLEACGMISIYQFTDHKPGLSLVPREDTNLLGRKADKANESIRVCQYCGLLETADDESISEGNCEDHQWTNSTI